MWVNVCEPMHAKAMEVMNLASESGLMWDTCFCVYYDYQLLRSCIAEEPCMCLQGTGTGEPSALACYAVVC